MKLTVTKFEAEGTAAEFAEAIPVMLNPSAGIPVANPTTPTIESGIPLAIEASSAEKPAVDAYGDEILPLHTDVVLPYIERELPHERVAAREAEWSPPTGPASPIPLERIEDWKLIPKDRLVWNSTKQVAHILRDPTDPHVVFCPLSIGAPLTGPPQITNPTVCQSCNRHIEISARPSDD